MLSNPIDGHAAGLPNSLNSRPFALLSVVPYYIIAENAVWGIAAKLAADGGDGSRIEAARDWSLGHFTSRNRTSAIVHKMTIALASECLFLAHPGHIELYIVLPNQLFIGIIVVALHGRCAILHAETAREAGGDDHGPKPDIDDLSLDHFMQTLHHIRRVHYIVVVARNPGQAH
jgi:hypothetical protein